MNFLKTSFYSAISTAVSLIVKLITNKVAAVYLGPNGMYLLGQLKDFLNLANVGSNLGTTNGTIKYTAELKGNLNEQKSLLSTSFKIHLYFSLLIFVFILVFNKWLSFYLFNDYKYGTFLILLGFSIVTVSIHGLFMTILNGLKKIKEYIVITIISSVISGIILILLIINYNITGALYAFAINQVLVLAVSLALILLTKSINLKSLFGKFSKSYFKKLSQFSLMALAGPICLISATFFVRYFIADKYDDNYAGNWDGMWRISAIYLLFLTTTFKFYLLPTFSSLKGKELKKEIFKIWSYIIPTILIITTIVYLFKDFIISTLLSKEFLLINSILLFHLLGDAIKINTWVLGNVLIAKAKTTFFISIQIIWAITFCLLTYILVNKYGFIGVSIAYFITCCLHFLYINIYLRKLLWLK